MYDKFIKKMTNHFSELGSIIHSKACDTFDMYGISKDEIKMYYEILNSDDVTFPPKVSRNNHIACCLYYMSKDSEDYKEKFLDKFLRSISVNNLPINDENLILIFNIIEFDKTYLNSPRDHILFLYQLLKGFSNFPTNFDNFITYKYFRGFLKFRVGDNESANKEYFEIVSETFDTKNPNYYLKYIKLRNNLLRVKLYNISPKNTKAEYHEYWQFLKDLYDEVKTVNKTLALKLGFDLFSAYLDGKSYNNCIPLLTEMKKLLKKELLKGATMKNGIDYYLAIASRLGYMGILLDNHKAINSAIKKIKKTLDIIKNDKNNEKLKDLVKAYNFILAILEVGLTKRTDLNLMNLSSDFQRTFLPDINSKQSANYLINEQNKDNSIIDFKIINNMNTEISNCAKNILNRCVSEIQNKNYSNSIFYTFIVAVHDKINRYSESYITDKNEKMRNFYKTKIMDYHDGAINFVYKLLEDEPLLYTRYIKTLIIDIFSSYAHVFIYEKNLNQIRKAITTFDDLKKKLSIEDNIPSYALVDKVKGDYWFYYKDFKAAISYYEHALELFEKNEPKIAPVLFNTGCAYFFMGNKSKAKEYLNRCINEYNNVIMQKNIYGFTPDVGSINNKIYNAKKLLDQLS